jgi:septin family protein
MTTITCLLATVLAVLTIPFLLIWRATESRHTRIQRQRRYGWTWKQIAEHHHCSVTTARRWAVA